MVAKGCKKESWLNCSAAVEVKVRFFCKGRVKVEYFFTHFGC